MDAKQAYAELIKSLREISMLGSVAAVLGWDQQTQKPPAASEHRAEQLSMLAGMIHQRFTSPRIGELLAASAELADDPHSDAAVNLRYTKRDYDRATKLPAELVEEMARTTALAHDAWESAKKKSDFDAFSPWLEKVLTLKRREADCIRPGQNRYDTLLDEYEPGETSANLVRVFESLRGPLVELVGRIKSSGREAPIAILERHYPGDAQEALARSASQAIGFDYNAGVLARSVHPFCTSLGPKDTRMTTRYDERYFGDAFFGVLHETGHGLYDQGLPDEHWGTPLADAVSLGIHESQSRMWENLVGRSRSFWKHFLPKARKAFPEALGDVDDDDWYFAINDVRPSLIRTEADEATYNLHVLLRFELEQALLEGSLPVKDLPGEWNARMQKYLGLTPPDHARGCLQDVHWSGGGVGYFPTYTLGNLYAAQFFEQARKDLGDVDKMFACGEFAPLLTWLRQNIHRHGRRYTAGELAQRITGRPLSSRPLLDHLTRKAGELYNA
jgi:carboxypeptidase Taq